MRRLLRFRATYCSRLGLGTQLPAARAFAGLWLIQFACSVYVAHEITVMNWLGTPHCHDPYFFYVPETQQLYSDELLDNQLEICRKQGRVDGWCKLFRQQKQNCSTFSEDMRIDLSRACEAASEGADGPYSQRLDICGNKTHGLFSECQSDAVPAENLSADGLFWSTMRTRTETSQVCRNGNTTKVALETYCHMQHGVELCEWQEDIAAVGLGSALREVPQRCSRFHCRNLLSTWMRELISESNLRSYCTCNLCTPWWQEDLCTTAWIGESVLNMNGEYTFESTDAVYGYGYGGYGHGEPFTVQELSVGLLFWTMMVSMGIAILAPLVKLCFCLGHGCRVGWQNVAPSASSDLVRALHNEEKRLTEAEGLMSPEPSILRCEVCRPLAT